MTLADATSERANGAIEYGLSGFSRRGRDVIDLEDASHGLLLEPLSGVSRVNPCPGRQLGGRRRSAVPQPGVQPEPISQVDGHHLEHAEAGFEDPPDEGIGRGLRRGIHWFFAGHIGR